MWLRVVAAGLTAFAPTLAWALEPIAAEKSPQAKYLYIDRSGADQAEPLKLKSDTPAEAKSADAKPAIHTTSGPADARQLLFITPANPTGVTPAGASSHLGFGYSPKIGQSRPLDIGISSSMVVAAASPAALIDTGPQKSYNIGLDVGWRGASLGAGLLHDESRVGESYNGFDVTLAYRWSSWSTALQFANLSPDSTPQAFGLRDTAHLYSLQLGAAYSLTPGITFSGGFKYQGFDTGQTLSVSKSQLLFLGTNIYF